LTSFLLSNVVTHASEMHREVCHPSHLLAFQMSQIKENMNDEKLSACPSPLPHPFIRGSWLETTQTEIPKPACKLIILPLIIVVF
jgi:hypothetical protein